MSCLKFKMLYYHPFYDIYHEGHDDLRIFFQIQDIWRTLKSKEGRYGTLNFTQHVTFEIQNLYLSSYSHFLITFIIHQIQIIWRTFKSKEGICGALNFTQRVTFEIQNPYLLTYSPFLIILIIEVMMICEYSFKYKTSGGP